MENLKQDKELLIQSNQNMSREVTRLITVDKELRSQLLEVKKLKLEIHKAEEEIQTKEFMVSTICNTNILLVCCSMRALQHHQVHDKENGIQIYVPPKVNS